MVEEEVAKLVWILYMYIVKPFTDIELLFWMLLDKMDT